MHAFAGSSALGFHADEFDRRNDPIMSPESTAVITQAGCFLALPSATWRGVKKHIDLRLQQAIAWNLHERRTRAIARAKLRTSFLGSVIDR